MRLLFLDIDGVLNDHSRWENRWSGIHQPQVRLLNRILAAAPDLQIVLSSAWRYRFDTVWSAEGLLCVHGVDCFDRVHGVTEHDPMREEGWPSYDDVEWWDAMGLRWRGEQIRAYVALHQPLAFVVLDDLPLEVERLVQTDGKVGLTEEGVRSVLEVLALPNGRAA